MSNEGHSLLKDSDLYRLFRQCKQLNALPLLHAENGALIEEVALTVLLITLMLQCGSEKCDVCVSYDVVTDCSFISLQQLFSAPERSHLFVVRVKYLILDDVLPAAMNVESALIVELISNQSYYYYY